MEAIDYQIYENEENIRYKVDSSTLTSDQIEIEDIEEESDRYTYVPLHPRDHAVLISCNPRIDRPDKHRECEIRKILWHGSSPVKVSDLHYNTAIVYESADEQWFTNACENIASLGGLWPDFVELVDTEVSGFRGVYSPNYKRKVIFSETISFKTSELPRWKPNSIIGKQHIEEDYA